MTRTGLPSARTLPILDPCDPCHPRLPSVGKVRGLLLVRCFLALVFGSRVVRAHDPGLSTATADLSSREILVQLAFAPADLAALHATQPGNLAARLVELRAAAGPLAAKTVETRTVGADNVEFTLRYPRPAGDGVTFRAPLLARLPFGHRQALTVRDESGATVATELLSVDRDFAPLPALPPPARPSRTRGWLAVGALAVLVLGWCAFPRRRVTAAA